MGWGETPIGELVGAGILTCAAAAIGAVAGTAIARVSRPLVARIMSGLVVTETTTLVAMGQVAGPFWFDVLSGGSLIVAILLGAEVFLRCTGATGRQLAEA